MADAADNLDALLADFDDDDDCDETNAAYITASESRICDSSSGTSFFSCREDITRSEVDLEAETETDFEDCDETIVHKDEHERTPVKDDGFGERVKTAVAASRAHVAEEKSLSHAASPFPFSSASLSTPQTAIRVKTETVKNNILASKKTDDFEVFDKTFDIRVKNPKITLTTLNTYCSGFKKLKVSQLKRLNPPKTDWLTMGVIVSKTECRKSAANNEYIIWHLSDLLGFADAPAKLLLFGDCVKQHWKLLEGNVVALTTPQIAESQDKSLTLKVSKAAQIIDIGFCPDYGKCQGVKPDGTRCSQFVNTSSTDYCVYHVQKAAAQTSAKRPGLGSQYNSPIGSSVVRGNPGVGFPKRHAFIVPQKLDFSDDAADNKKAATKAMTREEALGVRNKENVTLEKLMKQRVNSFGRKNVLSTQKLESTEAQKAEAKLKKPAKLPVNVKDLLKKAAYTSDVSSLLQPTATKAPLNKGFHLRAEANRQRLAERIRAEGGASASSACARKRTAPDDSQNSNSSTRPASKKSKVENTDNSGAGPSKTYSAEALQRLLGKPAAQEKAIGDVDRERQENYFKGAEVRERIESHLTEVSEIKDVNVVTCKTCDYICEKRSSHCLIQGHAVQKHKATKRFFKCSACKQRLTAFVLIPTAPCRNCGCKAFDRVGMRDERKIHEEKLVVRGEERKYVNC